MRALETDPREWVKAWNENPKPFIWTRAADQILESLGRLPNESTARDTSRACRDLQFGPEHLAQQTRVRQTRRVDDCVRVPAEGAGHNGLR